MCVCVRCLKILFNSLNLMHLMHFHQSSFQIYRKGIRVYSEMPSFSRISLNNFRNSQRLLGYISGREKNFPMSEEVRES